MAKTSDYHKSEILGWFVSKFGAFMTNEMMRNIIGQTKSSLDLRSVMDDGKILFVNLSKGRTGELNSKLLGMIFVMKFQTAAMSRAAIPEEHRRDFSLYVDEFQNFSTDSFASILSEARKYHLNLIVANQFITQLTDEIRDAVFGNVGSMITLRVSPNDAEFLIKNFSPTFDIEDLVKLPNYNAIVKMLIDGTPTLPFTMVTIPPLGKPNPKLATALKRLSAAKYGRPRELVEKEIFERLSVKNNLSAGVGMGPMPGAFNAFGSKPQAGFKPVAGSSGKTASFLDEWLQKRKAAKLAQKAKTAEPDSPSRGSSPIDSPAVALPQHQDKASDSEKQVPKDDKPNLGIYNRERKSSSGSAGFAATNTSSEADSSGPSSVSRAKDEAEGIAQLVRQQIKNKTTQPHADPIGLSVTETSVRQPENSSSNSAKQDTDDMEIYIDKDGKLHYKDETRH